jgi:aspartyl-tRNA(Asn)/glutamyl-tRNA(Gln) amidotransferase subunit B
MRCDVNISLFKKEGEIQGQRVEVKNVLGIRFVEKAIEFEMRRHADILANGDSVKTETRRYDAAADKTISMRSKEDNLDYRFLVDSDLPIF